MAEVYLGLGSNLGDRAANILSALALLSQKVRIFSISSLYETEPMGYKDQPWFLNLVCAVETELAPRELLELAKEIEKKMGRRETGRFGPRPIDIDILFYNALTLDSSDLVIPHPRLAERAFVLIPLKEVAPKLVHPLLKQTVEEIYEDAKGSGEVRLYHAPS